MTTIPFAGLQIAEQRLGNHPCRPEFLLNDPPAYSPGWYNDIQSWVLTTEGHMETLSYDYKSSHNHSPNHYEFNTLISSHTFEEYDTDSSLSEDSHHFPSQLLPDSADESIVYSDPDADAQYIIIPYDSPWYRPPLPTSSPVPTAIEYFPPSCSCDVQQALAQQTFLLHLFYEELRRSIALISGGYDTIWLDDVDAELLLAPTAAFEDVCWQSAVAPSPKVDPSGRRLLPDVPVDYGDDVALFQL